jgi:CubicO group peptidase (beta-lactamase class C family)
MKKIKVKIVETVFISLFLFSVLNFSCTTHDKELINLLNSDTHLLNPEQINEIVKYSKLFPDETEYSIAFLNGDSVRYVGVKKENDTLKYVNNKDNIFGIASITKTFTGTILAKLVMDEKIMLDEPIKNVLPVPIKQSSLNGKEVTVLNLANHTSGIPREPNNQKNYKGGAIYNKEKLYDYLSNYMVLQSEPGKKRYYSNLGFGLLTQILTLKAGKSYGEMLSEIILSPLNMNSTFVQPNEKQLQKIVKGRDPKGKEADFSKIDAFDAFLGVGGISSSATDLTKYVRAFFEDTTSYYHLALQPTFEENEQQLSCLGWGIYKLGEYELYPAFGAGDSYSCGLIFEKETKTAIILLTNVSGYLAIKGDYVSSLCRSLSNIEFKYLEN